jgi:hypothetical protein
MKISVSLVSFSFIFLAYIRPNDNKKNIIAMLNVLE